MSLRGGRNFLRPTRQSLTERNGIPERSLEKQREAVCVLHARHHLVFLVSCSRIKQQAGANKSVCSCLFCLRMACPPNLLARRRFNDPAYCIALFHTVPLRILPIAYRLGRKNSPDAQREGCGSQGSQQNPSQGDWCLRFRPFYSVPDGSYCKRGKNVL